MYELWCDYVKAKYNKKTNICFIDADSFIVRYLQFRKIFTMLF